MSVVWQGLPEYVLSDRPAREIIDQVIDIYETHLSHEAWQRLRAPDWDDGETVVTDWLRAVLQRDPPPQAVRGCGLASTIRWMPIAECAATCTSRGRVNTTPTTRRSSGCSAAAITPTGSRLRRA
jgi:hypothetical protein